MSVMTKGGNCALSADVLTISLVWSADIEVDLSAVLLSSGRVGSNSDFVFYNQSVHPTQSVKLLGKVEGAHAQQARIQLDLVPDTTDSIMLLASVYGGTMSQAGHAGLLVDDDERHERLAEVHLDTGEPVVVAAEVYRRMGLWKLRSVSQGYAEGLAGLARDFGIGIDDDGTGSSQAPTVAPTATSVPAPRADEDDPLQPGWYEVGSERRWFDGNTWTSDRLPIAGEGDCPRCGQHLKRSLGSMFLRSICKPCVKEHREELRLWAISTEDVLRTFGPDSSQWRRAWVSAEHHRLSLEEAAAAIRSEASRQLELYLHSEGATEVGVHELGTKLLLNENRVNQAASQLADIARIRDLRNGRLPIITNHGLHLEISELVHLLESASYHRQLASGPRISYGRLMVSNVGISFSGDAGHNLKWSKVTSVTHSGAEVLVHTTYSRGDYLYRVADGKMSAAIIEGALKVAKRLVSTRDDDRDDRVVPQHVKAEVWQRDGGKCVQCGETKGLHYDHIVAWSRGGSSKIAANIQLLCVDCNLKKSDKI